MTSCWQFYLGHYSSTGGKESKSMYTQINVLLMSPKGYISNCPPSCQKKPKCTLISKFVRACHYQFEAHSFKKKKKEKNHPESQNICLATVIISLGVVILVNKIPQFKR